MLKLITPLAAITAAIFCSHLAYAEDQFQARAQAVQNIAELPVGASRIRFDLIGDSTVVVSEIGPENIAILDQLQSLAKAENIKLCPAQMFAMLSTAPVPSALWLACSDPNATLQLKALKQLQKTSVSASAISNKPSYCVGATGYISFRDTECTASISDMINSVYYSSDNAYWCRNTLRSYTNLSMAGQVGSEGEVGSIRAVSCSGNTRVRLHIRGSTSDPWNLSRDYTLGPQERIAIHVVDGDPFADSDFRFLLESASGAWHRSTGYFIDD